MRWVFFTFLAMIYLGGIIGSLEFFKARFECTVFKDIDAKTCDAVVWINAASWPFNVGRELARWSHENEVARQKKPETH